MIKINMDKAREIATQKLREYREPKLAELDLQFMRAMEKTDKKAVASIVNAKQELRDLTKDPRIKSAKTPEDLKALLEFVTGK